MRPVTARVNTANPVAYVRLDEYHGAALAVAAVIEAGGGVAAPTPSRVQGGNFAEGAYTPTMAVTLPAKVGVGNTVIVTVQTGVVPTDNPPQGAITSVLDDKGNAYALVAASSVNGPGNFGCVLYARSNIANSPQTITVTVNAGASGSGGGYLLVDEFVLSTGATVDVASGLDSNSGTTGTDGVTSGSATTTAAGDLIYGATINYNGVAVNAGTGFTGGQMNVPTSGQASEWRVQPAAGAVAGTFTATSGATSDCLTNMVALKNPGSAAAGYQIDYTFQDPNDLISPVPLAAITWDKTLIPAVAQAALASTTFTIQTAPVWARVQLLGGATSVRVVFTQYDEQHMIVARVPPS